MPARRIERGGGQPCVNCLRLSGKSPNHKQIIVTAQGIGSDQTGIDQGCLADVFEYTLVLDYLVVWKRFGL